MNSKIKVAAIAAGAFTLGGIIGASSDNGAAPAPTVTVTSAPKVETKTVTKEVTPASCTLALRNADRSLALSGEGFRIVVAAMQAMATTDVDALVKANRDLTELKPKLEDAVGSYRTAAADCRAAGAGSI